MGAIIYTGLNVGKFSTKEEKTMCRKAQWSISHKGIQKCTSLNRNGVQVRDGPDGMTRNLEKQIMNLCKLMGGDTRISTPLNGSTGEI